MNILNIIPQLDSLHRPDTLNAVQAELASLVDKVTTTPASELLKEMIESRVCAAAA